MLEDSEVPRKAGTPRAGGRSRREEQEGVGQNGGQGLEAQGRKLGQNSQPLPARSVDVLSCCPRVAETETADIYFLSLSKW